MPKGPEKDRKNKALHNRKKAKLQEEKAVRALRLKAIVTKMNQQKNNSNSSAE